MENESQARGIRIFLRMKPVLPQDLTSQRTLRDVGEVSASKGPTKPPNPSSSALTPSKRPFKTMASNVGSDEGLDDPRQFIKEDDNHVMELRTHRLFDFDHVFDENARNRDVWDLIFRDGFDFVFENRKVAVLMYGQTASGKTHTMKGRDLLDGTLARKGSKDLRREDEVEGVVQLTLRKTLSTLQAARNTKFNLKMSYLELYNEEIYDLMDPTSSGDKRRLKIRTDDHGSTVVDGLSQCSFDTLERGLALFERGEKNRKFAYTKQNHNSSRSHVFLEICIETRRLNGDYRTTTAKIILADLAGSEKYGENSETETRAEAKEINKSLLALSRVITQLNTRSDFSLFRDSKLTRILQPYLTGTSRTTVVCTISLVEKNAAESVTTLTFGMTAKGIKFASKKEPLPVTDGQPLSQELADLRNELSERDLRIARLEAERDGFRDALNASREDLDDALFERDSFKRRLDFTLLLNQQLETINQQHQTVNERITKDLEMFRHRLDSERKSIRKLEALSECFAAEKSPGKQTPVDVDKLENLKEVNKNLKKDVEALREELRIQKLVNEGIKPVICRADPPSNSRPKLGWRQLLDLRLAEDTDRKQRRIENQPSYEELVKEKERLKGRVEALERDERRTQKREAELRTKLEEKCSRIKELQRAIESKTMRGFHPDFE